MKVLILFLLFWPAPHIEKGTATLGADGKAIARFKQRFPDMPKCTATGGKVQAWSREGLGVIGKPGQQVKWQCQ